MNDQIASAGAARSVFISHASKNFKVADSIRDILEARGVSCWIAPRDIQPGKQYGTSIIDGISNSSVFLLLLTDESNLSPAVQNEVERAFGYQKTIIPVRIADVKPGKEIEFFVSNAQWVDAIYQPLKRRMDEVAAIVQAIEISAMPPPVKPEKKTLSGSVEKLLERVFRHKTLSMVCGFLAVLGMTVLGIQLQTQGVERVNVAAVKMEQSGQAIEQSGLKIEQSGAKIESAAASIQESSNEVAALNKTLGTLKKEISDDPRKQLVARGYTVDSVGLRKAMLDKDLIAIGLFNASDYAYSEAVGSWRYRDFFEFLFGLSFDTRVAEALSGKTVGAPASCEGFADTSYFFKRGSTEQWPLSADRMKVMAHYCGADRMKSLFKAAQKEQRATATKMQEIEKATGVSLGDLEDRKKQDALAIRQLDELIGMIR